MTAMTARTAPAPETLDREATAAAYALHHAAHEAHDWQRLVDLFAEDARYHDPFYGWTEGKAAIAAFMQRTMTGLDGWTFPIAWHVVGDGRVVVHWHNRLPGARPDGAPYEFPGVSMLTFGPDGKVVEQRDLYDRLSAVQVILSARTGAVGRAVAWAWRGAAARLLDLSHRAITMTERT